MNNEIALRAIESLMEMVMQHCIETDKGVYYSSFMTVNESAIDVLVAAGFAEDLGDGVSCRLNWDKIESLTLPTSK